MVICDEKDEPSLDLDSFVSKDAKSALHTPWEIGVKKHAVAYAEAIPPVYRVGYCFTDFWIVYQAVVPEEQHTAVGKETGETAHVERWNNTLRQRLARFVRKTPSFSKSILMHDACLNLFLHRYNLERAAILM